MTIADPKADLRQYLQHARDAIVWKVEGLSEYDMRRPLTPTGMNLLGLVKHLAGVEIYYFGDTFGRPLSDPPPWSDEALLTGDPVADMYATAGESAEYILGWYRRAWAHADQTFDALDLDAVGQVPWFGQVNLHFLLMHVVAETHRHAGHADIGRELIDGRAGLRSGLSALPDVDQAWWVRHHHRLEKIAREAVRA
jgi:uncharacterized damage-inducible protein DinB